MIHTPMMDRMMATQADALNAMLQNVPIGRLGRPEEIASAVLWLCSSAASFMRNVFHRYRRIDAVLVEQIDVIGPQALQHGLVPFSPAGC
jgi:NAD(P)-dependent dehydrogenase (short-subunit alcohol dehydrogenase family)